MTETAAAISNETREGNCTAGELAEHFDISKPSLSHHLATLKNAGLVTDERHGQNIVYSLNTTVMQDLIGWFMGFTNTEGDKDEYRNARQAPPPCICPRAATPKCAVALDRPAL